jgi:hypothetical protein
MGPNAVDALVGEMKRLNPTARIDFAQYSAILV